MYVTFLENKCDAFTYKLFFIFDIIWIYQTWNQGVWNNVYDSMNNIFSFKR